MLTVTEKGYGKRTAFDAYSIHKRGGIGIKNYQVTERTGKVAGICLVDESDDLLVITDDGTIIRVAVSAIGEKGRATQGVRVMKPVGDAKVICIEKTEHFSESEEAEDLAAEELEPDAE